ncbi:MAG TPA: DUF3783 domain-containing protein [Clostridiaceae bacterium]
MDNNKILLVYGFDSIEVEALKGLLNKANLPKVKKLEKSMGRMVIADIVRGLKIDTFDLTMPEVKMVLFNNLTDEELNEGVALIRNNFEPRPILAVVTQASEKWTLKYLLDHLIEENLWAIKNKGTTNF